MLTHTPRWSHPPGNEVVPSPWQAAHRTIVPDLPCDKDTASLG